MGRRPFMRKTRSYYITRSVVISSMIYILLISSMAYTHLYTPKEDVESGIEIDFMEPEEPPKEELSKTDELENLSDEERRNIAVNEALKNSPKTDPYDYSDVEKSDEDYKKELVKNAISEEEYKKIFERDDMNFEEPVKDKPKEKQNQNQTKPSNYQGSTYISYFLQERTKKSIPVPTYQCEQSGKVTIDIVVDMYGTVVQSEVNANSTGAECLREAALRSARRAKFSVNKNAPPKQRGTITYIFAAQ